MEDIQNINGQINKYDIISIGVFMKEVIKKYIFYFFVFSIFGWLWEGCINLVVYHRLVNCGTLQGPWLPIYGWGMIYVLLLSKVIKNKYLLFFAIFLIFGIAEYSTSLYLEYMYDAKWWDYSNYLLNINGRTCIEGLLIFSSLGMFFLIYAIPFLNKIYKKITPKVLTIVLSILVLLYTVDYIYSTITPNKIKEQSIEYKELTNVRG